MNSGVTIEPLDASKFALAAAALGDPDINRWMYHEWQSSEISERTIAVAVAGRRNRLWLVNCGDAAYGIVALGGIDQHDATAMTWYLRFKAAPRQPGAMAKGVALAARHGFETLRLNSVSASVHADNAASARLLEAVGFRRVGILREGFRRESRFVDRVLYDLLASDPIMCGV